MTLGLQMYTLIHLNLSCLIHANTSQSLLFVLMSDRVLVVPQIISFPVVWMSGMVVQKLLVIISLNALFTTTCHFVCSSVDGKQIKMTEDHKVISYSEKLRFKETGKPLKEGETRLCGKQNYILTFSYIIMMVNCLHISFFVLQVWTLLGCLEINSLNSRIPASVQSLT